MTSKLNYVSGFTLSHCSKMIKTDRQVREKIILKRPEWRNCLPLPWWTVNANSRHVSSIFLILCTHCLSPLLLHPLSLLLSLYYKWIIILKSQTSCTAATSDIIMRSGVTSPRYSIQQIDWGRDLSCLIARLDHGYVSQNIEKFSLSW